MNVRTKVAGLVIALVLPLSACGAPQGCGGYEDSDVIGAAAAVAINANLADDCEDDD